MKTKFPIGVAAILAVVLAIGSCKKRDDLYTPNNNAVLFSAHINPVQTKGVIASSWSANDAIGIFMVKNGTTEIVRNTLNRRYTTSSGDGNFLSVLEATVYYPLDGSSVDFISYYPHRASISTLGNYAVNVADQSSPAAISLLYAKATNNGAGYDRYREEPVNFEFHHQMSRVRLTVNTPDPSVGLSEDDLAGLTAVVSGLATTASFNLADGTLSGAENIAPIALRKGAEGLVYEGIVIPDEVAEGNIEITFTAGSRNFVWELPALNFERGMVHTYTITLSQNDVAVGVAGQIVGWEEIDIEVEEPEEPEEPEPEEPEEPEEPGASPITNVFSTRLVPADLVAKVIPSQTLTTQAGDHVFVFAQNNGNTYPDAPGGYTQLAQAGEPTGGSPRMARVFSRVATGPSTALGEWTNTNGIMVVVLRGVTELGSVAMHGGQNILGPLVNFPIVDLNNSPGYLLTFASAAGQWGAVVGADAAFDVLLPTPPPPPSGTSRAPFQPWLWAGITKNAYTVMPGPPALLITHEADYQGFIRATVAIRVENPVLVP